MLVISFLRLFIIPVEILEEENEPENRIWQHSDHFIVKGDELLDPDVSNAVLGEQRVKESLGSIKVR